MGALRSLRRREVAPRTFVRLASLLLAAMFVVVTSGAFVRLTGSGLGCENWPRCGDTPYPQQGFHAFVEFGNRVVAAIGIVVALTAWLASRRTPGLSQLARLAALGAFLGAAAQIPLGGVTVILDLHPLAVMAHFLLALLVVGLAVVVLLEAWSLDRGRASAVDPRWLRGVVAGFGLPLGMALVVTGAVSTASGPHPGADDDVKRLGLGIAETVYWHVRVAAVFGVCVVVLGVLLARRRRAVPGVMLLWAALLATLMAQAIVGEVQYRNALPWGLVLAHVFLAATAWMLLVALTLALYRPPAPLVAPRASLSGAPRGAAARMRHL
jgi:heme a synthase